MESEKQKRSATPPLERRAGASLAHDINDPLEVLLCLLYLAKSEPALSEKGRDYLTRAEEEVQHISEISRNARRGAEARRGTPVSE